MGKKWHRLNGGGVAQVSGSRKQKKIYKEKYVAPVCACAPIYEP